MNDPTDSRCPFPPFLSEMLRRSVVLSALLLLCVAQIAGQQKHTATGLRVRAGRPLQKQQHATTSVHRPL